MLRISEAIGRYAVERLLGWGSFGYVLLARDPQLQRQVAIERFARRPPGLQEVYVAKLGTSCQFHVP